MSISFEPKTFGSEKTAPAAADRPKAQLWLNIGYESPTKDEEGNPLFISLPQGIPLDTQEHLKTNSRNQDFAQFQAARNDLIDQLMAFATDMAPGEARTINLSVQLRRVNEEQAPVDPEKNTFAKKLTF